MRNIFSKIKKLISQFQRLIYKPKFLVLITIVFFLTDYILSRSLGNNFEERFTFVSTIYTLIEIYIVVGTIGLLASKLKSIKWYKSTPILLCLSVLAFFISDKVTNSHDYLKSLNNIIGFFVIVFFLTSIVLVAKRVTRYFTYLREIPLRKTFGHRQFENFKIFNTFVILCLIISIAAFLWHQYKVQSLTNSCTHPFEVKDFTSRKEPIWICNDIIYRGSIEVVSKQEYPELFEFVLNKDSKPDEVKQYVRVFEKDKQEYVSMKSLIDYTSWNDSSIGIYRKEGNEYKLIFKKTFSDNQGRWVNIEFGEDFTYKDQFYFLSQHGEGITISGDIGYLGCLGRCRLLWWDFYDWDSIKKTFVLANNKHPENFKILLEDYEEWDKTTCLDEANVSESISNLYTVRKNKESICSDDAREPYTTPKQAEMLLKGKKAIELIINGENIPMAEVDKVNIDL